MRQTYDPRAAQNLLDSIVRYAGTMQAQCMRGTMCSLRDNVLEGGCFIGYLLTDEEAIDATGEPHTGTVRNLVADGRLPSRLRDHETMLHYLQEIHDRDENWNKDEGMNPVTARDKFRGIAKMFELSPAVIDEVFPATH